MRIIRSRRVPFEKPINYGHSGPTFSATTTNISESGLHLLSDEVLATGETVSMTIYSGKEEYQCKGVVAWVKQRLPGVMPFRKHEMGIKFSIMPQTLIDRYQDMVDAGFGCLAHEA